MINPNILVYGYGVSPKRTEAISLSTLKLIDAFHYLKYRSSLQSIDILWNETSLLKLILSRNQILRLVSEDILKNNYTHIVDIFALPLASILFTLPLLKKFPKLIYVKEVQNDYGFSRQLTGETLIRIIANNKLAFGQVLRRAVIKFTRNKYLSHKYKIVYLPTLINTGKIERSRSSKLRIGYLGHPLRKKGIYLFPEIIEALGRRGLNDITLEFALSDIGPRSQVVTLLRESALSAGLAITISGQVTPSDFFRNLDIYLLPVTDEFGAASTPNTVLEAMEAGCVVMTVMTNSVTGVLSPDNSILLKSVITEKIIKKLVYIYENQKDLKQKSNAARDFIKKNYSRENYLLTIRETYEEKK